MCEHTENEKQCSISHELCDMPDEFWEDSSSILGEEQYGLQD
jgi:hypothetical protein